MKVAKRIVVWGALVVAVALFGACPPNGLLTDLQEKVAATSSTYTVTYNGNGATAGLVPVDANRYQQGQTVNVLGNSGSLAKSGAYSFIGWNTKTDGSGTTYTQGSSFKMGTANVTLYAQWTLNPTYNVTYNPNLPTGSSSTGSVPTDPNNYLQGATVMVQGNGTLAVAGYTFTGWSMQASGGIIYEVGVTFTMGAANVTLYAQWTQKTTYNVTYNANVPTGTSCTGNVPTDPNNYLQGAPVTVQGNGTLATTGYTFSGWSKQTSGGTIYTQGQMFTMGNASVTLYAVWTLTTYTITYNLGGGTNNASNPATYNITTPTIMLQYATLSGWTFMGWWTAVGGSTGSGTQVTSIPQGSTGNLTLYAYWPLILTLENKYGLATPNPPLTQTVSPGAGTPISVNSVVFGNYFTTWMVDSGSATFSTQTNPSTTVAISAPATIYPATTPGYYVQMWTGLGGTPSTGPQSSATFAITTPASYVGGPILYTFEYWEYVSGHGTGTFGSYTTSSPNTTTTITSTDSTGSVWIEAVYSGQEI
jgi:uncharacterized repeat protein (TIGR02543 family)